MTIPVTPTRKPIEVKLVADNNDVTKQLVILGVSALISVGILLLQRKMMAPDTLITMKMRCYLWLQDYADERAKYWHTVAGKAATAYLDSRP
jgi:hypothetical protein